MENQLNNCDDDINTVDAGPYYDAQDISPESWPTEADVSSEVVLKGVGLLKRARDARAIEMGF